MTYLVEAHSRLIAKLCAAKPATISMYPTADEYEEQAKHIREAGRLFADYLQSVAIDGKENLSTGTISQGYESYVADGVSELAGEFETAAELMREDEPLGRSAEHSTLNHAQQGIAR